uniref:Proteasome activator complex subunit 1 n=1 Tax=Sus scrofa TaxID=9823 RepID=A0A8D1KMF1_PIG
SVRAPRESPGGYEREEVRAHPAPIPSSTLHQEPALNEANLSNLKAPLDIPVPDPVKEKEKEERKKQQEKEDKDEKKKGEDEDKGPPCGPVNCNEKIVVLLQRLKPEIKDVIEQLNLVTTWLQLQIPRIEDGNNFGVAVQEKVFELMTALHTKLEGFHTQISKYFSERGDAVAKAAKQPHVGDYRQLVHELDEAEYRDIRLMVMEIRNAYVSREGQGWAGTAFPGHPLPDARQGGEG